MSLIFTQNCKVIVPVGGSGVTGVGDETAETMPVNPFAYGPPVNAIGPVTVGTPQPPANVVLAGTTSARLMFVILAADVLVPMIRYAIHLPGIVLTLAETAALLQGALGVLPARVVVGIVTQEPVPPGDC